MLKNMELIGYAVNDIIKNPSIIPSINNKEKEFISLFSGKENHELKAIVRDYPLVANIFISTLYDRVIQKGIVEGLSVDEKFKVFKRENITGGAWSRTATDIKPVKDFDPSASPVHQDISRSGVCYSVPMQRKKVEFTWSMDQLMTCFDSETGISEHLASEFKSVKDSITLYINDVMYDVLFHTQIFDNFKYFKCNNFFDEIFLTISNTFDITKRNQIIEIIKSYIINYAMELSKPSRLFNKGDTDGGYMRNIPLGQGILILSEDLLQGLNVNADKLFGNKSDWEKYFSEIILAASDVFGDEDEYEPLFGIYDKNAVEYRIILEKNLDWTNPRALYTNYYTHFWFSYLVNPFVNAVVILNDGTKTPFETQPILVKNDTVV